MYPVISYNNKQRCEQRWEDDANIYGDISTEWQVSLGNGKRLNRRWKRCRGLAFVSNQNGGHHTIYNDNYDVEWQKALEWRKDPDGDTYLGDPFTNYN